MSTPWNCGTDLRALSREGLDAFLRAHFEANTEPLGRAWRAVEAEYYLTRPEGTDLVHAAHEVVDGDTRVLEYQTYMAESRSPRVSPWTSAQAGRRGVLALAREALAATQAARVRLTTIALRHTWGAWGENKPPEKPAHAAMVRERMPTVNHAATGVSYQHHTPFLPGMQLGDRLMWARQLMEQHAPLLAAAGANSYHPQDHSASTRVLHCLGAWSFRLFGWRTYDEFVDELYHALADGMISGPESLHPWVKICSGSLEQRVCDMPGDVREMMSLSAVMQAIAIVCYEEAAVATRSEDLYLMVDRNGHRRLEQALREGAYHGLFRLDQPMWSPWEPERKPMGELFAKLERRIGQTMSAHGYAWEREYFFRHMVREQDNGARRQEAWWNARMHPREVLDADHAHFVASIDHAVRVVAEQEVPSITKLADFALTGDGTPAAPLS